MAAWAQMLNYIITVAISAFFVPHYLSIFWEPLKTNPWDIIGGAAVILILVAINIVGIKEAAGLNIFLAVVDFATQLLLVIIGFAIVFHPHVLTANVHWGIAPTWGELRARDPGGDDRVHRDRDRLEPRRGGARPDPVDPGVDPPRRGRRLRDLLHAAARRPLGAAGLQGRGGRVRDEARPAARTRAGSRTTRCSASSRTSASTAGSSAPRRSTSASSRRRSSSSPRTPA